MNNPRNRVTTRASTIHHCEPYYRGGNNAEDIDERFYHPPRRSFNETGCSQNVIPRESFKFEIARSPSLQSRGTSEFTDTNYESSEETTSEDGYYSGDRQVFVKTSIAMTNKPIVTMPQKQLSVPEVRHRSHSTPTSPEIRFSSKETKMFAQPTVVTLSPYNDGALNYRQEVTFRKHSYGNRDIHQINNDSDEFRQLRRSPDLSSSSSIRRRLPPTPDQLSNNQSFQFNQQMSSTTRIPLQQVKSSSLADHHHHSTPMLEIPSYRPRKEDADLLNQNELQQPYLCRRGTGRKLPKAPNFSRTIKNEGYQKQNREDELASFARPCQTPPPPLSKSRSANSGYQPDLHTNRVSSPNTRKLCQRRPSDQSIEQYVGVRCTCTTPSTNENLESRSSSDTEDHCGINSLQARLYSVTSSNAPATDTDSGRASFLTQASSTEVDDKIVCTDEKSYGLGQLLFSMQYFSVRKRLRVSVNKAQGLAGRLKPELELNTFVKVCLLPGKLQKQHGTRIVKGSRDASYNEEFFFDNITTEEIQNYSLAIYVCHHVGKQFQKDIVIGEIDVALNSISNLLSKQEIKIQCELKPKQVKVCDFR